MRLPKAEIFEVGPRDGLQAQNHILSVEQRVEFILRLARSGLSNIEVGSFVRPDRIPQLDHSAEVMERAIARRNSEKLQSRFWAFVPNQRGLDLATEHGAEGVSFFVASSNTFCQKNVNRTQAELMAELKLLLPQVRKRKLKARVYVSTIAYCPYEGWMAPQKLLPIVKLLKDLGAQDIALGDTTGHATPHHIEKILALLLKKFSSKLFSMHFHDTRALALPNVLQSLQMGVTRFDSSAGGLGGCPYAPGAAGNLPTEDLLYFLENSNLMKHKVKLSQVADASRYLESQIHEELPSRVLQTFVGKKS